MTATEELRRLLDEHGVEYRFNERTKLFEWHFEGTDGEGSAHATEVDGGVSIIACSLTPEQAIAATLGPGTCRNNAPTYLDFLCSECGFVHYHSDANDTKDGNGWGYCPNCGRRIVEVDDG